MYGVCMRLSMMLNDLSHTRDISFFCDWFKCSAFSFHKRDDRREWDKDQSCQNDLKIISFILTEIINVSQSPLRHELLILELNLERDTVSET